MARIPYFDVETAEGRTKQALEQVPPLNIFRMMAHSGPLLGRFLQLGQGILGETELDPILRELAIVRVGLLSGASYEVHQHDAISRQLGMSEDKIAGLREGPGAAPFSDLENAVLAYTDDIVKNVRASDSTFNPLLEAIGPKQLQELTVTIGFYMMVSRFLETFDVDIEDEGGASGADISALRQDQA